MIPFERKTKWIILTCYHNNGDDYCLMARRGLSSGDIQFRNKNVSPTFKCSFNFNGGCGFDIKEQFQKLLKEA